MWQQRGGQCPNPAAGSSKMSIRVRVPGFEPGISPPQGEVLTTILHTPGEAGYRSLYLSHAKRALYHLSYIPTYHAYYNAHNTSYNGRLTHRHARHHASHPSRFFPASSLHAPRLKIHTQPISSATKHCMVHLSLSLHVQSIVACTARW